MVNMNAVGSMRSKIAKAMINRIKKHSDFNSTEDPLAILRKQSYGKQLQDADKLDFDIFSFVEKVGRPKALGLLTAHCMSNFNIFTMLSIDQGKFGSFIDKV